MTQLASSTEFIVRPATDDDLNYVRKTWLWAHAQGASDFIDAIGGGVVYFAEHARLRDAALERAAVTIAHRPDMPNSICGFAVTEELPRAMGRALSCIHFVYVKDRWRKLGVAKLLLRPFVGGPLGHCAVYTHRTEIVEALQVPKGWAFNPYPFLRSTP